MGKEKQNPISGKDLHEDLVRRSQDLVQRISESEGVGVFEGFVKESNEILKDYILGYTDLSIDEAISGQRIIYSVRNYTHGCLDEIRVGDMNKMLRK